MSSAFYSYQSLLIVVVVLLLLFTETDPEVVKSTNQYVTIENLRKYTNYTVWVLAYTKVGDGMKTKPFYCRTHEDGKWQRRRWFNERKRRHGTPREGHGGTARPLPPELAGLGWARRRRQRVRASFAISCGAFYYLFARFVLPHCNCFLFISHSCCCSCCCSALGAAGNQGNTRIQHENHNILATPGPAQR